MSSPPTPKTTARALEPVKGLPFEKFLSTLCWAADAHPTPGDTQSPDVLMCTACRKHASHSTEDVAGSADRLDGFAVFRVAREHRLAFSPRAAHQKKAWRFPAAISVFDGKLRLALQMDENGPFRCLLVDTNKILVQPELHKSSNAFQLQLMFPFVSVVFELEGHNKNLPSGADARNSGAAEMRLTATKDAISDLLEGHSSSYDDAASSVRENKPAAFKSLYDTQLDKVRAGMDWEGVNTREIFSQFEHRCTTMTMPLTFPYRAPHAPAEGLSVDQSNHVLLVDAFLQHEATRLEGIKQAQAWVEMATKSREMEEDKMLSKEDIEARRKSVVTLLPH